jgi:L-ascorbate metabolism protein UlaG (beta-lactamase superfamily)
VATLDWYGCATFRLRTGGLTVFLDAYIDRAPDASGTGLTADDIDECDWIVIGHAHFDHLYGAERIMARTNATLIGSYESVRVMEAAGVPADRMICVAGGERVRLSDDVTVSVLPSQHSCVWSHSNTVRLAFGIADTVRPISGATIAAVRRLCAGWCGRRAC